MIDIDDYKDVEHVIETPDPTNTAKVIGSDARKARQHIRMLRRAQRAEFRRLALAYNKMKAAYDAGEAEEIPPEPKLPPDYTRVFLLKQVQAELKAEAEKRIKFALPAIERDGDLLSRFMSTQEKAKGRLIYQYYVSQLNALDDLTADQLDQFDAGSLAWPS